MRLVTVTVVGVAIAIAGAGAALAQEHDAGAGRAASTEVQALYREGSELFARGRYEDASARFLRAYELSGAPELLFNLGQAYRLSGPAGCAQARDYYRAYLRALPRAFNRASVERSLEELAQCPEPAPTSEPPRGAPERTPPTDRSRPSPPPPPARPSPVERAQSQSSASIAPVLGWTAIAVGAAASALGIVAWRLREARAKEYNDDMRCLLGDATRDESCGSIRSEGETWQAVELVGFAAGGALVLTGAALVVLAPTETTPPIEHAMRCTPSLGTWGLSCGARF